MEDGRRRIPKTDGQVREICPDFHAMLLLSNTISGIEILLFFGA